MALRYTDGFDAIAAADIYQRWGGTAYSWSIGTGRLGGSCLRAQLYHSGIAGLVRIIDAQPTWIVGAAIRITSYPATNVSLLDLRDAGTVQVSLGFTGDYRLRALRGEWNGTVLASGGPAAFVPNAWYYVEFKVTIHPSAGTVEARVNGEVWFAATGLNTRATANSTASQVGIARGDNSAIYCDYDDLYVCDATGSVNNDFLGDLRVQTLRPSAAGASSDFVLPYTGAADYRTAVLADTPVHFWELQETAGSAAADTGVGTAAGATFPAGRSFAPGPLGGNATDFSLLQYASAPHQTDLNLTADMTAEAWLYALAYGSDTYVYSRGQNSAWGYVGGMSSGGLPRWVQGNTGQNFGSVLIPLGRWVHQAFVRVGTSVSCYMEGALVSTLSFAGNNPASSTHPVWFGGSGNGATAPTVAWSGRAAYVAVYPTALSAARIAAHRAFSPFMAVADAAPDADATYVQGDAVGQRSVFAFEDTPAATATVRGVQLVTLARKDDVGVRSLAPVVRASGGTAYPGTGAALTTSYVARVAVYETDPGTGSAWTKAGVDGAQLGIEVTA